MTNRIEALTRRTLERTDRGTRYRRPKTGHRTSCHRHRCGHAGHRQESDCGSAGGTWRTAQRAFAHCWYALYSARESAAEPACFEAAAQALKKASLISGRLPFGCRLASADFEQVVVQALHFIDRRLADDALSQLCQPGVVAFRRFGIHGNGNFSPCSLSGLQLVEHGLQHWFRIHAKHSSSVLLAMQAIHCLLYLQYSANA